jgi:peptidoglycan-associated lipoprotein
MRVLLVLAMIPLLAACSVFSSSEPSATLVDTQPTETAAGTTDTTGAPAAGTSTDPASVTPTPVAATPTPAANASVAAKTPAPVPAPAAPAPSASSTGADISGKWVGSWIGTGLFNAPRQENLVLELVQKGDAGYGKMVLDNAIAAESVPWEVRQQGLFGIRVFATIDGSKVRITHDQDDRVFTANLTVNGDQMIGEVKGRKVRLLLARQGGSNAPAREVPPQASQVMPPPIVAAAPPPAAVAMAPAPQAQEPEKPKAEEVMQRPKNEEYVIAPELKSVYFDFDKANLRQDAVDTMVNNVTWLKENADTFVLIEGNADERGTAEYNLALGDRRAKSTMDYLEANGIPKDRMATVSYGKEHPTCTNATEECRYQNRRADFRVKSR